MKNTKSINLKTCIFKVLDEFKEDVNTAFNKKMNVNADLEGITIEDIEDDYSTIPTEEINKTLSKYYDCNITSIHIDDCETIGVWIAYKN